MDNARRTKRPLHILLCSLTEPPGQFGEGIEGRQTGKKALYELRRKQKPPSDQETPWDWFDKEGDWRDILEPHGWTSNGDHWTRPGKSFGTSAAITTSTSGAEVLCVFSSNAGPLAPGGGEAHRNRWQVQRVRAIESRWRQEGSSKGNCTHDAGGGR